MPYGAAVGEAEPARFTERSALTGRAQISRISSLSAVH
jgi:hypothetical protein